MAGRPNVLVVVLDCVRESDFRPSSDGSYLPHLHRLAPEFVRYDRTLSPASWTLPSHASLFSGLYPWEHGMTTLSGLKATPDYHSIAGYLRSQGYASVSISANFLIGTTLGIVNDFDSAYWGGWWEPYFRYSLPYDLLSRWLTRFPLDRETTRGPRADPQTGIPGLLRRHSSGILRHVYVLDFLNRLSRGLSGSRTPPRVSSWLEPTLGRWLARQPAEKPVFAFINLLDAHEPYFSGSDVRGWTDWWRYSRLPQERWGWIDGSTRVSPPELEPLHRVYRDMIRILDERVAHIVEQFKSAGRWDNTLMVLTSDHGQAFGEHGHLFHAMGVEQELTHVPLWVHYPGGEGGGQSVDQWASLVDVVPTILDVLGQEGRMRSSGFTLRKISERSRPSPVYSVSDGYGHQLPPAISELRKIDEPPIAVAACAGEWKVIVDHNGDKDTSRAFNIHHDPKEQEDVWKGQDPKVAELGEKAQEAVSLLLHRKRTPPTQEIMERLASWGYT